MGVIETTITGLEQAVARMLRLARIDTHDPLAALAGIVLRQTQTRIQSTKTDPDGAARPPDAASTLRSKRKGDGLPVDSGALLGSIQAIVAGDAATVRTNLFDAPFQQFGTSRGIPPQAFLGIGDQDKAEIEQALLASIGSLVG